MYLMYHFTSAKMYYTNTFVKKAGVPMDGEARRGDGDSGAMTAHRNLLERDAIPPIQ